MLFSYFNFMCISMYSHFRTRFRFFLKKKCVQTRNLNTDLQCARISYSTQVHSLNVGRNIC